MATRAFLGLLLELGLATAASAHFVFVTPQPGGAAAQVFLSEGLKPTGEVDAGMIAGTRLRLRGANGAETPLNSPTKAMRGTPRFPAPAPV